MRIAMTTPPAPHTVRAEAGARWRIARAPTAFGVAALLLAVGQPVEAQAPAMAPAAEEAELPHPFFTHMGLPEGVGVWNLRIGALAARQGGRAEGDFAFHLETGLTRTIGLHVRNDRFLDVPRMEAMFQFAAFTTADAMSGFAPLIEFEVPTRSRAGDRVNTLVGFTSTLANRRVAFNQALHYDPREDGVDASASIVASLSRRVFPVVEILGEGARGMSPAINLLGGLKVRLRERVVFGLAYQFPASSRNDFSSQLVAMPELEW